MQCFARYCLPHAFPNFAVISLTDIDLFRITRLTRLEKDFSSGSVHFLQWCYNNEN